MKINESDMNDEIIDEIEESEDGSRIEDVIVEKSTPTIDSLIGQWNNKFLEIPEFQRKFVWTLEQSSKFIESLMLGLPIPSLMFYEDANSKQLIVDGQQRMKTILLFVGAIDINSLEKHERNRHLFKLKGLSNGSQYCNRSYADFTEQEKGIFLYKRKLDVNLITLKDPNDLTSIYYIFERLNTGGTPLTAQEIRNCIYDGPFNKFIKKLNQYENWKKFFTNKTALSHRKDIELILRFFALYDRESLYKRPMKEFLSKYMGDPSVRYMNKKELENKGKLFKAVVDAIDQYLPSNPFHIRNGLNSSVCDATMIAFAKNLDNIPEDIADRYRELCYDNEEFYICVGKNSNDPKFVHERIKIAEDILFRPKVIGSNKTINLYELPVSAGLGNWIDSDYIPHTDFITTNENADFAVRISGDSMEPQIPSGSIVTVQKTQDLVSGKIGIFTLNGEIYCKKFFRKKEVYLISVNKKYRAIKVSPYDNFRINGMVLDIFVPNMSGKMSERNTLVSNKKMEQ